MKKNQLFFGSHMFWVKNNNNINNGRGENNQYSAPLESLAFLCQDYRITSGWKKTFQGHS